MKQVKLYGLGGQGVVTAAKVFAEAVAIGENRYAQSIPAYGHERRGAPVYSDLMLSDTPITVKSFVYHPDYIVVFDLSVVEKGVDITAGASKDTVFIVNWPELPVDVLGKDRKVYWVDARAISLDVLKLDIPNTTMLGAMAGAGMAGIKAVKDAITKYFAKAGELNAKAAERAFNELKHNY